mgnify:CR=1 FL=1
MTRADVMSGYTWNVVYFIRQLHVRLLMGFWGRVFVGMGRRRGLRPGDLVGAMADEQL